MAQVTGGFNHQAAGTYTNTVIKSTPGQLLGVYINTKGAGGNTLSLFDHASASSNTIAVIDTTAGPNYWPYNLNFVNGLNITSATGTGADVTLVFG